MSSNIGKEISGIYWVFYQSLVDYMAETFADVDYETLGSELDKFAAYSSLVPSSLPESVLEAISRQEETDAADKE